MTSPIPLVFVLPDLGGGGAQRVMLSLARRMDPARFSLHLIVIGVANEFAADVPAHVTLERLDARRLSLSLPGLIRSLRRAKPKVIFCTMGYMNLILLAIRPFLTGDVQFVVREANVVAATLDSMPRWVPARRLYGWLYPRAAAIVAQTKEIAKQITMLAPDVADRIVILPNPTDESASRALASTILRPSGTSLVLVAGGRLTRQKGFDRLIALMPHLPDARLAIFGDGPDRVALEQKIEDLRLQDRVFLRGFSPELASATAGADVFLLPSRWEGLPNVVLEALALGTPVVASEESGVEDIARVVPGAVTIAPVGPRFVEAIARYQPSTVVALRPSLLPAEYRADNVATRFNDLFARVAQAVT